MTRAVVALAALLLALVFAPPTWAQPRGAFDAGGRLLMQGQPRFLLGVYDSGGAYSTDPAQWEQQIFSPTGPRGLQGIPINAYLNYWMGAVPIEQTNALLDVLHRRGIMYLQTGNCFENGGWRRPLISPFSIGDEAYVRAFARHPAALGYYIADECSDSLIPETEDHHRQLKSWDPRGLTFAALMAGFVGHDPARTDPAKWVNAADLIGTDPYPVYAPPGGPPAAGYPHFTVADYVSKMRAAIPEGRPVVAVLQMFKGTDGARMPTPDEMRAHAVMAIVEGAQGIFWWEIGGGLRRAGTSEATAREYVQVHLRSLVTELAGLEPALVAPNVNHLLRNSTTFVDPVAGRTAQLQRNVEVDWLYSRKQWYQDEIAALQAGDRSKSGGMLDGAANVRTRAAIAGDRGYVFAYNYRNTPEIATFTVPGFPPFSWTDALGPYQARIYVVSSVGGVIAVRENRTGQAFPVHEPTAPPPLVIPPVIPPVVPPVIPPRPSFTASFSWPAPGATVSGAQGVNVATTADWSAPKTFTVLVDGAPVCSQAFPKASTYRCTWDTTRVPNGAHEIALQVNAGGQTATASISVTVRN